MKIGLVLSVYNNLSFDDALRQAAEHGYESVELSVHKAGGCIDLDEVLKGNNVRQLRRKIEEYGLTISALANHAEGQLVLGPHHRDTDSIFKETPSEKIHYAMERMKKIA